MFRLIVVGKNKEIAIEGANWVSEQHSENFENSYKIGELTMTIKAYPVWIDMPGSRPIGDGLLLIAKTAEDLADMESTIEIYKKMPIKFVLYDGAPEQTEFEIQWSAKSLAKGEPKSFVEMLIGANNDLVKLIANVFKVFDKNSNGTIELVEIGAISKELGIELSADETAKIMQDLDINKDGKISLEEFISWWKTGGQGKSNKLGSLLKEISKKNPMIQTFISTLKDLKVQNQQEEVVEGIFTVSANKVTEPGIVAELSFLSRSQILESEAQVFIDGSGLPPDVPFLGIALGVKNPKEASEKLESLIDQGIMMAQMIDPRMEEFLSNVELKYGFTTDKAMLSAVPSEKLKELLASTSGIIDGISNIVLPNQSSTIKISLATDCAKFATEERPFYDILLDGVNVEISTRLNPDLNKYVGQLASAMGSQLNIPSEIQKVLIPLSFISTIFKSFNGDLEFEVGQAVREALNEVITEEEFKIPLKVIKESEGPSIISGIASFPPLNETYNLFKEEVSSLTILLYSKKLGGIKINFTLPGLQSLLTL